MQHHHVIEAINRTLRDILDKPNLLFGGITVAWGVGGLPADLLIVPRGNKEQIVNASIQRSHLWCHLTENMHVS